MGGRPVTRDHLVGKKKPLTKRIPIVLDPDLAEEHERARRDRDVAQMRSEANPKDPESAFALIGAEDRLAELRRRLEDEGAIVWFTLRGIGRTRYDALLDAHPPTAEMRLKAKAAGFETASWNWDTFPPALVHACLVDSDLTLEDLQEMWDSDDWNQAELTEILNAAVAVNGTRRTVELGKD